MAQTEEGAYDISKKNGTAGARQRACRYDYSAATAQRVQGIVAWWRGHEKRREMSICRHPAETLCFLSFRATIASVRGSICC